MGLMLVRQRGESFRVGEATITIVSWGHANAHIRIDAPPHVEIMRAEIDYAEQPASLADRLVAKIQEAERMLAVNDKYAPILEQTRAMIRREEANT